MNRMKYVGIFGLKKKTLYFRAIKALELLQDKVLMKYANKLITDSII